MRHGEDEDGKPETGALKATEKDREINEDEEVNLDEIPHSEINVAKLELKSLIDNNSQLSETLKSKIESQIAM
mgnify:CR=1 FL=1